MASTTITIASGATASSTLDMVTSFTPRISPYVPVSVDFPAMTGSYVTLQVSADGSTWVNHCYADGTAVTLACGGSAQSVEVPNPIALSGRRYVRLVAASSQSADRTITVNTAQGWFS